ncbi:hypothetical protein SBRCBS47491_006413 [Sporothrix bragantina]|uniref:Major facilitator superfamily (MFS) profile domain-containing protein n=1 Tax=Sporothrix bragantina TaxID=671064 RepID=A0ABP0C4P6_9PEZI
MATLEKNVDVATSHRLGTLRLRHEHTNEILLIPTPSDDPKDPLTWPKASRLYVAGLSSFAIFLCTFGTAGPAIAIPEMAITFFGPPGPTFLHSIAKTAYFFTVPALMMGISNLLWVPLMIKYGRRFVYVVSFALYTAMVAWSAAAHSYGPMLAARTLSGFMAGAGEVLGPLTIADLFFVHERGTMMIIYTCTLSIGSSLGNVVAGLIMINKSWRIMMWLCTALIGATTVLMFFTLPETYYVRSADPVAAAMAVLDDEKAFESHKENASIKNGDSEKAQLESGGSEPATPTLGKSPSIIEIIRSGLPRHAMTSESVFSLLVRPVLLIMLPSVLWSSLVMSVVIGFLVAISSNCATAFSDTYGLTSWQIGLCAGAGVIGSIIGVFFGGHLSDMCADYLTRRNGGIREPEMRLPMLGISLVTAPLSLILYGVGIGKGLHWIVPTIGMGLLGFSVVQSSNITVVYMIDCYRPIAGEITVTQYAFKSLFGFLLSFYTNTWIDNSGYVAAFGEMAAIAGGVFLGVIPFYLYGKTLRRISWEWTIVRKTAHWDKDREVGE